MGRLASLGFFERYPQHAAAVARLEVVWDPRVETMAVSIERESFYLHLAPAWRDASTDTLVGVVLHEVHHLVFGHLTHRKFDGLARPDLLELAMETSANEGIREQLPSHVSWQAFADLGFRAGQSTLERYTLLARASASAVAGACRGGAGTVDDHEPWSEGLEQPRRDVDTERAGRELAELFWHAGSQRGGGPGDARRHADVEHLAVSATSRVNWVRALRAFVTLKRERSLDYGRPNRRFADRVGIVPARSRRELQELPTLLVAIDTSGSVSIADLESIAAELTRAAMHTRLVIAECDTAIRRVYPYEGELTTVHGRGGTDLRPVFRPSFLDEIGAGGVVFFTDGDGPVPARAPRVPTLWVLTRDAPFACPWGARVSMNCEPGKR